MSRALLKSGIVNITSVSSGSNFSEGRMVSGAAGALAVAGAFVAGWLADGSATARREAHNNASGRAKYLVIKLAKNGFLQALNTGFQFTCSFDAVKQGKWQPNKRMGKGNQ